MRLIQSVVVRYEKIDSGSQNQLAPTPASTPEPPVPPIVRTRAQITDEAPEFVPQILAQLEDELARSRMREAFWISVIVHIVFILLVVFSPQWLPNWAQPHLIRAQDLSVNKEPTFLALPQDLQKPPEKVQSDKVSDKNRIAQTTHPIDKKTLEELKEARLRGNQTPPGPPAPRPQSQQPPAQQQPMPQAAQGGMPRQPQESASNFPQPRIQQQQAPVNPFKMPGSAGAAIAQAARNAPRMGTIGGGGGSYGLGPADRNAKLGPFDVLSDTQGVDFGPYLSRVLQSIKQNWYTLIPEEARAPLLKHGKVAIRFLITPTGRVTGMFIEMPSGDIPLDRAAYGGITASDPFSPLPHEFHGPYLALRITFFYNPKSGELEE